MTERSTEAASTPPSRGRILVVDDERAVRSALRVNLTRAGYEVTLAEDGQSALDELTARLPDLVLTDLRMPRIDGMLLLEAIHTEHPQLPVVMMTGHGSVRDAVKAMQSGAADYVIKPIRRDELLVILERALRARHLEQEVDRLRRALAEGRRFEQLIGAAASMERVYARIEAVADTDAMVLVTGPTGAGKELVSRAVHARSSRKQRPFVALNCAALPEHLLESELFGHEKGAFTGAVRRHAGRFEQASGGTLLLDEIGEIPLATQVRLLRVLESGQVQRVGGQTPIQVDTRVIAATNRDLTEEVQAGRFRADLYYRLNVFHIPVPPLDERRDDIPALAEHFIRHFAQRHGRPARQLTPTVLDRLQCHSWPGNVRQLAHVIERAVLLSPTSTIEDVELDEVPPGVPTTQPPSPLQDTDLVDALRDLEARMIIDALQAAGGVQAEAARRLGVSRSNLHYRVKKLGIELAQVRFLARRKH